MGKCPECGESADDSDFMSQTRRMSTQHSRGQGYVIKCPNCDVILGGAGYGAGR
jgi:hypothetical protein